MKATVLGLLFLALSANANVEMTEGFDRQSPEEIARAKAIIERDFQDAIEPKDIHPILQRFILDDYNHLDPKKEVPADLLKEAVLYFDANMNKFSNQDYITIIDFSKRSDKSRFFVIDMETGTVAKYHTAHGHGSDKNRDGWAEFFGNVINSGASSIGFIRTAEVYEGKFKTAVRLDGLSKTNSNLRERAIVLHGWDDAHEKDVIQGLSWGCPAMDWNVILKVIGQVKEGSLMYMGVSKIK